MLSAILLLSMTYAWAQNLRVIKNDVPLDSIRLSDPFIMADKSTSMYYMTGTGGLAMEPRENRQRRWSEQGDGRALDTGKRSDNTAQLWSWHAVPDPGWKMVDGHT
jgi:hypothetical protein